MTMKLLSPLLIALMLLACAPETRAEATPPANLFEERVKNATHIFVGVARKITVMGKNGEVKPEPKTLDASTSLLMEVEVREALTPAGWKPSGLVKVASGELFSEVEPIRQALIGKPMIYTTRIDFRGRNSPTFKPSFDNYLTESLEKKAEMVALIKPDPVAALGWSRKEWLAGCMSDIEAVKVGTTREELNKRFYDVSQSGNYTKGKYSHRQCPFLVFEVEFTPAKADQPTDQFNPNDVVARISPPMVEWVGG